MFVFDTSAGCAFEPSQVWVVEGEQHAGRAPDTSQTEHADEEEHGEVHARVEVRCARTPEGTKMHMAVTEVFPNIVNVDLQVLSKSVQSGARVAASGTTVQL
jgi:hypothetical protein